MSDAPEVLERYSPRTASAFAWWLRGYFARGFDAVRVAREGPPPDDASGPLLVYANHPSWWDPIHFLLLARETLPERRMFGPFDAAALGQYGFFRRIGGFGIDPSTRRGAADFLRTSRAILATEGTTLWITAQGEFADPRSRPVELRPGVAHLVRRLGEDARVVPLAVEYPFWNERRPEALSYFGRPVDLGAGRERSAEEWNEHLAARLEEAMDALGVVARRRDPGDFRTLVLGRTGVGGVYDFWRRLVATLRGERFRASHGEDRR